MKIRRFKATGLHGYLAFDIKFDPNLTFLTGINGCGKTTVVRAIVSLITPAFMNLCYIKHKRMSLEIEHNNKIITIISRQKNNAVHFSINGSHSGIDLPIFSSDDDIPLHRQREEEEEYYAALERDHANKEPVSIVRDLPTPMFLGLERRVQSEPTARHRIVRRHGPITSRRNIFGATLLQSLYDSSQLVYEVARETQYQRNQLTEKLRKQLILHVFRVPEGFPFGRKRPVPDSKGRQAILERKKTVKETLFNLGIKKEEISSIVNPFFETIENVLNKIPADTTDIDQILGNDETTEEAKEAAIKWLINGHLYDRMDGVFSLIDEYTKENSAINKEIDQFLANVNQFFDESGKTLFLDDYGRPLIRLQNNQEADLDSLSSGERQIFVILSHLAFHTDAKGTNVLIIDEPELSLHVSWQERFCAALQEANPQVQMIFATHSPAIILDRVSNCIDLG